MSQKIANTLDPVPDVSIDNLLDTSDVYFTDLTKILNYNRTESPIEVGSSISEIEFNAQQAACRRKAQTLKEQLEAINSDVFIKMNSAQ